MLHFTQVPSRELDEEWIQLILEARDMGLTPEQIRIFIEEASVADAVD